MPTIPYYIKQVYGNDTMYLLDPKFAKIHRRLTDQITLTPTAKSAYEELGFIFTLVLTPKL